ncbi:MAG: hypothetical protein K2M69_09190 [Muribaculaceae bacterium]|nr:hypothetical protein [Muribaculaceae bacterium]
MKKVVSKIRSLFIYTGIGLCVLTSGCKKEASESAAGFPTDFNKRSDEDKVAFVMRTCTPDSVARFVMNASLGRIKGIQIDTLSNAELYVFSNYNSEMQQKYAEESVRLKEQLTLAQRMQLFKKGSTDEPISFGLDLGLGYLSRVRERNMSADDVAKEIKDFKKECGNDTATYRRFTVGFTEALRQDRDKDVKKEIYDRFINLSHQ